MEIINSKQGEKNEYNLEIVSNTINTNAQNVEVAFNQCQVLIDTLKQDMTTSVNQNENVLVNVFSQELIIECERIENTIKARCDYCNKILNSIGLVTDQIVKVAQEMIHYDWCGYTKHIFKQWELYKTKQLQQLQQIEEGNNNTDNIIKFHDIVKDYDIPNCDSNEYGKINLIVDKIQSLINCEVVQGYGKKKEKEKEKEREGESRTIISKGTEILTIVAKNGCGNVNIDISVNIHTIIDLKFDSKFLRDIGNDCTCCYHDYLMTKFRFFIIDDGG